MAGGRGDQMDMLILTNPLTASKCDPPGGGGGVRRRCGTVAVAAVSVPVGVLCSVLVVS